MTRIFARAKPEPHLPRAEGDRLPSRRDGGCSAKARRTAGPFPIELLAQSGGRWYNRQGVREGSTIEWRAADLSTRSSRSTKSKVSLGTWLIKKNPVPRLAGLLSLKVEFHFLDPLVFDVDSLEESGEDSPECFALPV